MIPRTVHLIWFQGADHIPAKYLANMQRLRSLNPGWNIQVWSDAGLRAAAAALGVAQAYDAATVMHQKIDLGRYCVLYIHGGITIDMDTWALRPLDSLPQLRTLDRLAVTPIPTNSLESAVAHMGCLQLPGSTQLCTHINNACLLAPAKDPALMRIIQHCSHKLLDPPSALSTEFLVNNTTGPSRFTKAVQQLPAGMVTILPSAYFEPCVGYDSYCTVPSETILLHEHDGTWLSSGFKMAFPLWYSVKHHWVLALFLTLALWLLLNRKNVCGRT